jgi:peptide/nickel transport system permease protein
MTLAGGNRAMMLACLAFLAAVVAMAAFGPILAPMDPNAQRLLAALTGPSRANLLGTDELGRDVLSRTIVGARTAVIGPAVIALGSMIIGSALGLFAGYMGGWLDAVVMRWADIMLALPVLLVAIVVVGILGGGYALAVMVLTAFYTPQAIRVVRAATLEQRVLPYVEAARTLGLSKARIMLRHIWPNTWPLLVANTFLDFALALVGLAGLSFLGLGVGPKTPDWGRMVGDGRAHLVGNPLETLAPGMMLVLTATTVNLLGDWLYERVAARGRAR